MREMSVTCVLLSSHKSNTVILSLSSKCYHQVVSSVNPSITGSMFAYISVTFMLPFYSKLDSVVDNTADVRKAR